MNRKPSAGLNPGIGSIFVCLLLGSLSINVAGASSTPCGHKDQRACPALRKGPECFDYTQKIHGICRARGGQGEKQYEKVLGFIGFDCKPGYQKDPNKKGYCTACGDLNQPSCEAARKGPQCDKGLKAKKAGGWKKCVPDDGVERELKKRATAQIAKDFQEILSIVVKARNDRSQRDTVRAAVSSYRKGVEPVAKSAIAKTPSGPGASSSAAYGIEPLELPSGPAARSPAGGNQSDSFRSWTIGAGLDANLGVGVSGETGMAFSTAGAGAKGYTSFSTDFQIGFGGSGGITVGLSTSAYNRQGGKSLGYKLSVDSILDVVKDLNDLKALVDSFKTLGSLQPDLVIGVWYGRKPGGGLGAFQGITATIGGGVGKSLGATYSQGQTLQF
jgi:hypothetical protein